MLNQDLLTKVYMIHGNSERYFEDGCAEPKTDSPQEFTTYFFAYDGKYFEINRAGHEKPESTLSVVSQALRDLELFESEISDLPPRPSQGGCWGLETIIGHTEAHGFLREDNAILRNDNAVLRRILTKIHTAAIDSEDSVSAEKLIEYISEETKCLKA